MVKKCQKMQKNVKKAGFHSIGATIRTHRESLPYTEFLITLNFCKLKSQNQKQKTKMNIVCNV